MGLLLTLWTTTALQVAIGTVQEGLVEVRFGSVILGLEIGFATKSAAISQGNVVGSSDSLVSPRHLDGYAWGADGNWSSR